MRQKIFLIIFLLANSAWAQKGSFTLASPDGRLKALINTDKRIDICVLQEKDTVLRPSTIKMDIVGKPSFGTNPKVVKSIFSKNKRQKIESPFYKKSTISDTYNEVSLSFKGNYSLTVRAYNEGVAYHFSSSLKEPFLVKNETADFIFPDDANAYIPYVKVRGAELTMERQFNNSFENTYTYGKLTAMDTNRLAFLPLLIETKSKRKVLITEADLEAYPGMYLRNIDRKNKLSAVFAPYPKTLEHGGYNKLQLLVKEREPYIAKVSSPRNFPWRIISVVKNDAELLDNDMVYKLASPSKIDDVSWIKPGKAAWDWWNAWNLYGVDFRAGINTETYKYYIDFASKKGLEYVVIDEGWAVNLKFDLKQVVSAINLPELINYAKQKNVGIILWAGYYAFEKDMEEVCRHYSALGVKGFKVDFMDRDDQLMVDFYYKAAKTAAKYKLILNLHGAYKPTGLQRTYPNVLNFEGIHGMEQMKWVDIKTDQVTYDVTFPFIRMVAGPVDYTQGAMRNASKNNYRAVSQEAMSQGTRCRQLASYIVFDAPLAMLCDNPVNYEKEEESISFISKIPTFWDQTFPLESKIGEYIVIARKKGDDWFIGGLNNWNKRSINLDLSFLNKDAKEVEIFVDGINADRVARDYKRKKIQLSENRTLKVDMAPGGGFAIKISTLKVN
ncbi:MAG: glycoside hydrolase family 97 protein [Pedobacter sp.]|uniref:glycoside hydrolase family 97 protein n=1 Tax=Pedobacter sp. TaxID=1411316 RepID=UPI0028065E9C|nr:glycoside hydrolase family 97 protein [Pedobacter sp.]MDQ8005014.1 glycoside hydrolase family 97 protein [Pedobacter sp.]